MIFCEITFIKVKNIQQKILYNYQTVSNIEEPKLKQTYLSDSDNWTIPKIISLIKA